jgi:hypothetical protein
MPSADDRPQRAGGLLTFGMVLRGPKIETMSEEVGLVRLDTVTKLAA